MVKVIGEDPEKKQRVTCTGTKTNPGCGAILEYDRNDIREYNGRDIGGGPDGRRWITCPRCGKDYNLESW